MISEREDFLVKQTVNSRGSAFGQTAGERLLQRNIKVLGEIRAMLADTVSLDLSRALKMAEEVHLTNIDEIQRVVQDTSIVISKF